MQTFNTWPELAAAFQEWERQAWIAADRPDDLGRQVVKCRLTEDHDLVDVAVASCGDVFTARLLALALPRDTSLH